MIFRGKLLLEEALFEAEEDIKEEPVDEIPEEEVAEEPNPEEEGDYGSVDDISLFGNEESSDILYKVEFTLGNFHNWSRVNAESEEKAGEMVKEYVTKKWPGRDFEITDIHEFTEEDEEEIEEALKETLNEAFDDEYKTVAVSFNVEAPVEMTEADVELTIVQALNNSPVRVNSYMEVHTLDESLKEAFEGKYSDKFYALVKENALDDEFLVSLCNNIIRYCPEEDLKDLWNKYEKHYQPLLPQGLDEELKESLSDYKGIRIGDTLTTKSGHKIHINDMVVQLTPFEKQGIVTFDYSYELVSGETGNSQCSVFDLKNMLNESLKESVTDAEPIETGAAIGMASVVSDLIKDEYEAIDGYNSAIATAEAEGFGDAVSVLTEIQAEEHLHVGQLMEVMKMFDSNADKVEEGQIEGAEQLGDPEMIPSEE